MAEILVEFVPDFTKLETGVDQLVNNGTISKEIGALFVDAGKSIDQFSDKFTQGLSKIPKGMADAVQKGLKPATDQAKKSIESLSKSGIKDLGELKKRVETITDSFTKGFSEGVEQSLKDAGFTMEDFNKAIKLAQDSSEGLKTELLEITKQLQVLKLNGEENSQQYSELAAKATLYKKAISDVSEQINKQASDTQKLDTAIEFVTGLASAFSILQGVQALAGKQNEEFQKTLLKVQAAMSILVGLQQLQNILKKESNLIQAVENTQKKLGVAITALDSAAQSKNIIVKGAATLAQRALNAAMEANPAFILIGVFTALAAAIAFFTKNTDNAKDIQEDFNSELERTSIIIEDQVDTIKRNTDLQIAQAKARGASEKEISDLTLKLLADENKARQDALDLRVQQQIDAFKKLTDSAKGFAISGRVGSALGLDEADIKRFTTEGVTDLNEIKIILDKIRAVRITDAFKGFEKEAKDTNKAAEDIFSALQTAAEKLRNVNIDAAKENAAQQQKAREDAERKRKEDEQKAKEAREKRLKEEADARQAGFQDAVAKQKLLLLQTEKGSREELDAKKNVLHAELQLALDNDKLTANQRKLLIQTFFKDQKDLTDQFNQDNKKKVLEDQASLISAQLAALNLSFEEREKLTVEQLNIERDLQLAAVVNNKSKEKEINAKFDKEIAEQRKAIREQAFAQEISDLQSANHVRQALAAAAAADEDLPLKKRLEALKEELDIEKGIITEKRLQNQQLLKDKLITIEEYNRRAKELSNDEFDATSKNQKEYTEVVKSESEKRLQKLQETVGKIADTANLIIEAFKSFSDSMNANEDARIQSQRDSLQRLRDLNALTEKEFIAKSKVIDRLERETKQKQAEREKGIALFEALVNGAAAIVKAAPDPFAIVATSILVAAQVAAIASRPIPKFGKGTEKAPKGLAEVGETGTEIIQTEKGYFIAEHPQIVWFKGGERVYNPEQTKNILTPQANMTVINNSNGVSQETKIDYDKMAKKFGDEIAKHPRLINNIDANGYSLYIQEGLNKSKYLNKRFTFK